MNSPIKIWREHKKLHPMLYRLGKILCWTIMANQKAIVLIEFDNKERMIMQIVDFDQLEIGQKVKTIVRKFCEPLDDEVIRYCIKVTPVLEEKPKGLQ